MENNVKSRLVINEIRDHLPVFVIYDCLMKKREEENSYRYVKIETYEAIHKFRNDLLTEEWKEVYVEEVDVAYETFLRKYLTL